MRLPHRLISRERSARLHAVLDDPKVRAALTADLQARAARVQADARRATPVRRGTTSTEAKLEPLRVPSERADRPRELEP